MDIHLDITMKGAVLEGKAPEIVQKEIESLLHEVTMFLEREVKASTPQGVYGAQGGLLSTIHGEVIGRGTPLARGVVAHGSKYGDVIEKGRRAGKAWPPEGSLVRWIEVKFGVDEHEARRIEFAVRRKIARKGFEGKHMFENAVKEGLPAIEGMADRRGLKIARKLES